MMRGFYYAFRGLFLVLRRERNLRVHLSFTVWTVYFGFLCELEAWAWAVCALSIGLVVAMEMINSAIERVCDRITRARDPAVGAAKDMAAGGVLASALAALAVGLVVFLRPDAWDRLWARLTSGHWIPAGGLIAAGILFIVLIKPKRELSQEITVEEDRKQ